MPFANWTLLGDFSTSQPKNHETARLRVSHSNFVYEIQECVYTRHPVLELVRIRAKLSNEMKTIKPRKSLTEETYASLLDAICYGELAPGHRINQDEIAEHLNVSRQPVNNAISLLKAEKLVEDTGRRGVVVSKLDGSLFASIYEFRRVIEPFAVRLASERINYAARQDAEKVLASGEAAIASGSIRSLVETDMAFHKLIYGWSQNAAIIASMQVNWHHIRRAMVEVLQEPTSRTDSWRDHVQIVHAVFDGDAQRSSELMENHIIRAYDELIVNLV